MKTIDYYMSLPYRLEIVPDSAESGYVATYPELPGCIADRHADLKDAGG